MSASVRRLDPEYPYLLPAVLRAEFDVAPMRRTTRDWIVDVLMFVLAGVVSAIAYLTAYNGRIPSGWAALDLAAGTLMWLTLWYRRRWPIALAVIAVGLGSVAVATGGAALALIFTVAVHRRLPAVVLVGGLSIVSFVPYIFLHPDKELPFWGSLLISVAMLAITLIWGMLVRARRQLVWSLRERAVRAENEQALRVEQAQRRERERIAREMHDVLAHRISLLSLHAGALEFRPDAEPAQIAQAASVIRSSAHQALQELREVISVLRDDPSDDPPHQPQPTLQDLEALVGESRDAGTTVRLQTGFDAAAVPAAVGRTAYRIVQEGLTNARKHAPGTAVQVQVHGDAAAGLTVLIENPLPLGDRGSGIPGTSSGLIGLAERVGLAGGRLEHGRTASGHFRLGAWLPLAATGPQPPREEQVRD